MHYGDADAELGASLSGGSVTRAVAALGGEEESLRAHVARSFFESVEGASPQEPGAAGETLDDGLETIKILVRDWIVASARMASRWCRSTTRPAAPPAPAEDEEVVDASGQARTKRNASHVQTSRRDSSANSSACLSRCQTKETRMNTSARLAIARSLVAAFPVGCSSLPSAEGVPKNGLALRSGERGVRPATSPYQVLFSFKAGPRGRSFGGFKPTHHSSISME